MSDKHTAPSGADEATGFCSSCSDDCNSCTGACEGCRGCGAPRGNLQSFNWLGGISEAADFPVVEVQFKNTRKGFYLNPERLDLHQGDVVAVEAAPGHDIGQVTMVGRLVELHMRRAGVKSAEGLKKIFRIATKADLEKFRTARALEQDTMIRSRKIAEELGLDMKIGDVEYQGDGAKAIFYYIADERVDFRRLIRVLADTFKIRIEMKQIGARQEAGRIGGIGPCGRPLCCASWMTGFSSVGTAAARTQDLSMNPQKLAGQCAKLKCCLNFEVDVYAEAARKLPPADIPLETADATYYHFKTDTLAGLMTYSTDKKVPANLVTLTAARVAEIQVINKDGGKVDALLEAKELEEKKEFVDLVGQDNINRFDHSKRKKKKRGETGQRISRSAKSKTTIQENDNSSRPAAPKREARKNNSDKAADKTTEKATDKNRRQHSRERQKQRKPRGNSTPDSTQGEKPQKTK